MTVTSFLKRWFTAPEETSPKINNFNIIRFVAALMVIYGHMASIMGQPQFTVYNHHVSAIGVKIFFVISGYLITKSFLNDSNFLRYMIRRSFRIFPGLIAVTLFAALIVGPATTYLPVGEYFRNPHTAEYLKNIVLYPIYALPGVFTDFTYPNAVNGSLWSLPVEFAMYLLLPFCIVIFKKLRCLKAGIFCTAAATVILEFTVCEFFPGARMVVWGNDLFQALPLIPFFFIGSFLSFPEVKKHCNLQLAAAFLAAGALVSLRYSYAEVLLSLVLPYFVISFAITDKPVFGNWFRKCDFSYGMYLYGFIVQQITYAYLKKLGFYFSLNVMTVICTALTLACAVVSWYLIEKPAQKFGQTLIEKLKRKANTAV